jgi:hypothetical protein
MDPNEDSQTVPRPSQHRHGVSSLSIAGSRFLAPKLPVERHSLLAHRYLFAFYIFYKLDSLLLFTLINVCVC